MEPKTLESLGAGELPMKVMVAGYQREIKWYAEFYGVAERTVKRWKKIGKEKGELPPLDDVLKFVAWWRVRMKHKVPNNILRLVPEEEPEPKVEEAPTLESVNLDSIGETSDMGLSTMRKVVHMRSQEVGKAYESGVASKISTAVRELEGASKVLRMLEKTQADLIKAGGDLVSKKEVQAELAPMINRLGNSFLEAMVRAARTLNPEMERDDVLAVCEPERDKCFSVLRGELVS